MAELIDTGKGTTLNDKKSVENKQTAKDGELAQDKESSLIDPKVAFNIIQSVLSMKKEEDIKEEDVKDEKEDKSRTNPNFAIFESLILRYCSVSNGFHQQPFLPELVEHSKKFCPHVSVKQLGVYFSSILRKVSESEKFTREGINKMTQDAQRFHKSFFDDDYGYHLVYVDEKIRTLYKLASPREDYRLQCHSFTNREKKRGRPAHTEEEEEEPKSKKRRASTKRAHKNAFATTVDAEDDEDEQEGNDVVVEDSQDNDAPKSKNNKNKEKEQEEQEERRTPTSKAPPKTKRASKANEDEDEEEEPPKTKPSQTKKQPANKKATATAPKIRAQK